MAQIHESMNAATQKNNPQAEQDAAVKKALSHIKHKLIVMSGKGGVGKPAHPSIWPLHWPIKVTRWVSWMWTCMDRMFPGCWGLKECSI